MKNKILQCFYNSLYYISKLTNHSSMSSIVKNIQNIQKQNDSIRSSLITRNISIPFKPVVINETDSIEEQQVLNLLNEENKKLKEIVQANRPPPQPKEKPVKVEKTEKTEKTEKQSKVKDDEDDEENYEEPVKSFDTITNMETLKRIFFSGDYELFRQQISEHSFKFYKVEYKYNSDKDDAMEFSAKNLLGGFVRNFDDYRKYFMICFRCWKLRDVKQYKYSSVWIVNTNEPIKNIIGSLYDDFDFEETTDLDYFVSKMQKISTIDSDEPVYVDEYTCIGESYVH